MKIQSIVQEKPAGLDTEEYKLSLYYPVADYESAEQQTRVKSIIKRAWREKGLESGGADRLWSEIEPRFERRYRLREGVLILARVNNGELVWHRMTELESKPSKSINWGKVFDLTQLAEIRNRNIRALIVSIKEEGCEVFFLKNGIWIEKRVIEKDARLRASKQSLGKYAPVRGEGTFYSWGWDKQERREETEKQWYANQVVETLGRITQELPKPKQVLLFHSESMREYTKDLVVGLEKQYPKREVLVSGESYQNKAELKRVVVRMIRKKQKKEKKRSLAQLKENFDQLKIGWNQVAKAVNKQQVRTLITSGVKKEGYVVEPNILFSHPVKNAKHVDNLNAWLVKRVWQYGGEVVKVNDSWMKEQVVAGTYY